MVYQKLVIFRPHANSNEDDVELAYDAGFGAGKYADDVASFAVTEMVKRGMK